MAAAACAIHQVDSAEINRSSFPETTYGLSKPTGYFAIDSVSGSTVIATASIGGLSCRIVIGYVASLSEFQSGGSR